MATKTAKKKKVSPAKLARRRRLKREEERRGLWVVTSNRMKQYGDVKIDGIGQIIKRQGLVNDGKLVEHNYVREVDVDEDWEKCDSCGLEFSGTATSGPYGAHQKRAKHNQGVIDTDDPGLSRDAPPPEHKSDADRALDSETEGSWDLEPEGALAPTKVEDEVGRAPQIKLR